MATPAQIRQTVDDWLAARWPTVQARQIVYAGNHGGRFYQGLWTHLIIPIDGANFSPDNVNARPTDQVERWVDFVTLPATFPAALCMDVYQNAQGWGYVASLRVFVAALGKTFERSQNGAGSETWRSVAWHEFVAGGPV